MHDEPTDLSDSCTLDDLQRRLVEAQRRYAALIEHLEDVVIVCDVEGRLLDVAGNTLGVLGCITSELTGSGASLVSFAHPDDRPALRRALAHPPDDGNPARLQLRVRDRAGELRWMEISLTPLDGTARIQCILRDANDRVQAERMMASLNAAAQAVQSAGLSPEDVYRSVSRQLSAMDLGHAMALLDEANARLQIVSVSGDQHYLDLVHELLGEGPEGMELGVDDVPAVSQAVRDREVVFSSLGVQVLTQLLPEGNGSAAYTLQRLLPTFRAVIAPMLAGGRVLGVLVVMGEDLTHNSRPAVAALANQTAIALRNADLMHRLGESEAQYRAIFEASTDGLIILDAEERVVEANPAACNLHGYGYNALVGRPARELLQPCDASKLQKIHARARGAESTQCDAEHVRQDGSTFRAEVHAVPLIYRGQPHVLVVVRDITGRLAAQEAMLRAERLHALGQMAGGIAHDFNNILVGIRGYADLALQDIRYNTQLLQQDLQRILANADDAAEGVRRLQALYRQTDDTSDFEPLQLDDLAQEALDLTRPRWKDEPQLRGVTITVRKELGNPPPVWGNASELRRVLSNLLANAVDAMPDGGVLALSTRRLPEGSSLRVEDTGVGIDPSTAERLFEPFFTTKHATGSGLGLTVSQQIVERHGGSITFESEPGRGSAFTLTLPCHTATKAVPPRRPSASRTATTSGRRILIVDDETSVLHLLCRMLRQMGHTPETTESGGQALEMLRSGSYDLLITDLGMPDVSGRQVARMARELYPKMPIVLCTGWGETVSPEQVRQLGATALLAKPFDTRELVEALQCCTSPAAEPDDR